MGDVLEVLYTSDQTDQHWSCCAWDYKTATSLMTYKGGGSTQKRSLCFVRDNFLVTANSMKPLFHVWPINNQEQISSVRFVAPGKTNCLATSPDGNYIVAGIQESLYVWQISSGRMLANLSKHYQAITCIKFTDDGSHFVSGGTDGNVLVWNLAQVLGKGDKRLEPLYTFNDHGLAVTDVHIGSGGMRSYMYSVSLDRTCKVYDLSSGTLLLNVVFTESLSCVVSNILETSVHVGTINGLIHEFHINSLPRTKEYHIENGKASKYSGHNGAVTCIALSVDGETMISGGDDGQVHVWHIPSKQLIRSLAHQGTITNVVLALVKQSSFNPEHTFLNPFANNLKRMMEAADAEETHTVEVFVDDEPENELIHNTPALLYKTSSTSIIADANAEEVERLKNEIKRLKAVNQKMFVLSTKSILKS